MPGAFEPGREHGDGGLQAASALEVRLASPNRKSVKSFLESGRDLCHRKLSILNFQSTATRAAPGIASDDDDVLSTITEMTMLRNPTIETLKTRKVPGSIHSELSRRQTDLSHRH